jgi:hypothetical protein
MKYLLIVLLGFNLNAAHAQLGDTQSVGQFLDSVDASSKRLIEENAEQAGIKKDELNAVSYHSDAASAAIDFVADRSTLTDAKRSFLIFLGAGMGMVDNLGASVSLVRKAESGRLTWFAEADVESLRPRIGYVPDDLRIGFGYYPFRRPIVAVSMKLTHSSYSDHLGVGPQLSLQKGIGKKRNVILFSRLGTTAYIGEQNSKGGNVSYMTDLKFGLSVKIFQTR